jgi:hypothetical protein
MEKQYNYYYLNDIKSLISSYTIMQTAQFVPFRISAEKTAFPPFRRVDLPGNHGCMKSSGGRAAQAVSRY